MEGPPRVSRCSVSARLGMEVTRQFARSSDWPTRISRDSDFLATKSCRWSLKLAERAALLSGPTEFELPWCYADVGFAGSREDLRWARALMNDVSSAEWCYRLNLFDSRAIKGLEMPTDDVRGLNTRAPRPLRRDERRWRHDHQVLFYGSQKERAVLTTTAIEAALNRQSSAAGRPIRSHGASVPSIRSLIAVGYRSLCLAVQCG